eukprot:scaffold239_cov39-Tisochrysis_lutea.AAC.2
MPLRRLDSQPAWLASSMSPMRTRPTRELCVVGVGARMLGERALGRSARATVGRRASAIMQLVINGEIERVMDGEESSRGACRGVSRGSPPLPFQ